MNWGRTAALVALTPWLLADTGSPCKPGAMADGAERPFGDAQIQAGEAVCFVQKDGRLEVHRPGEEDKVFQVHPSQVVTQPSAQAKTAADTKADLLAKLAANSPSDPPLDANGCPMNKDIPLPEIPAQQASQSPSPPSGGSSSNSPSAGTAAASAGSASGAGRSPASNGASPTLSGAIPSNAGTYAGSFNDGAYATDQLGAAQRIAATAGSQEIVDNSRAVAAKLRESAFEDHQTLAENYKNMSSGEFTQALQRAKQGTSQMRDTLSSAVGGMDTSERVRFELSARNAVDKVDAALELLKGDSAGLGNPLNQSPLGSLLSGAPIPNPLARTPELTDLFGADLPKNQPATADALVDRLIMLAGLPEDQRRRALSKLRLLETPTLTLPTGAKVKLDLPHNGYWLGGGKTGVDCSSFVSAALPADLRKGAFTTLDYMAMWRHQRTGKLPNPPIYEAGRAKLVRETAAAFDAIDIYSGQRLAAGDLLVYRFSDDPIGHVVLVTGYNSVTAKVSAIDASQSRGGVGEREFSLLSNPSKPDSHLYKPGFYALRLKPADTRACRTTGRLSPQPAPPTQPSRGGAS